MSQPRARDSLDTSAWSSLIADLAASVREAAAESRVCERLPQLLAAAFRAAGAAVVVTKNGAGQAPLVRAFGTLSEQDALGFVQTAIGAGPMATGPIGAGRMATGRTGEGRNRGGRSGGRSPRHRATEGSPTAGAGDSGIGAVVQVVPGADGPLGVLVLDRPASTGGLAVGGLLQGVASLVGSSLAAVRMRADCLRQGAVLALRDLELGALRELAGKLHLSGSEEELLDTTLGLVLDKLDLDAGWIFVDYAGQGRLELAASRGVAGEFVAAARREGIGTCLCKDVFETGRLQYARNTAECPRLPALVKGHEPMTHACIPLKFDRGVLGVMNIANRPGRLFGQEELRFLETVGHQLCLAVDKERTSRAELKKNSEARALASLARAIGGSLEQDHVMSAVGQYARELLTADRCMIFVGDAPTSMHFAYLTGDPLEGLEPKKTADFEAFGSRALTQVLRERRTMAVADTAHDARVNHGLAARWEIGSSVIVPLMAHERLQGLLIATRRRASRWSDDDVALADALAGQAAMALETARLYGEAQDALLRLQQAQFAMMRNERLAAIGTLAASLAHEVRNPLNSINLQLVLLSRRLGRLDESSRTALTDLVETARREITRLDGLVEEFLSLSTIDRLSMGEASLDEVVREAVGLMAPLARQKGISVTERLAGPADPLRLDREKIEQVLINLVRNAIEAMGEGGTLTVSTEALGASAVVRVADTGGGIEPGLDVFDFFSTTKRGGTGLGLPIAKRIVEAHGGTLGYESVRGAGATFAMTLKLP